MRYFITLILFISISYSYAQWNTSFSKQRNYWQYKLQKSQFDNPELAAQYETEITKDPLLNKVPYGRREKAMKLTNQLLQKNKSAISNVQWTERGPKNVSGRTRAIMFDPNFSNNNKVWAAGITGGLWYNIDVENNGLWNNVGSFWTNIAVSTLAYDPTDISVFYAGTGEGWTSKSVVGAGIWRSTDAGENWERLSSTNNLDFLNTQKIVISTSGRIFASTSSGLFISDDKGDTWTQKIVGFFGDIEITSNGTVFVSQGSRYEAGTVYRSTNDGDSWQDLEITTDVTERTELASSPSNPDIIYAVSSHSRNVSWFKKSTDGGDAWVDIEIPMYLNQNCSPSSDDFTRGQAWYDLIMMVHPDNENIVYVGGIDWHKTTDGGASWECVSYWTGACNDYVHADQHAMVFFPNDNTKALVGCDGGVFLISNIFDGFTSEAHINNSYNVTQFYGCAMENKVLSNYMLAGAQDNGTQKFTSPGFSSTTEATGGDGGFCFIDQDDSQTQITSYVYNNWRLSTNGGESFYYYPSTENGSFINPADFDNEANVLYASSTADTIFVSDIHNDGNYGHYKPIVNGLGGDIITTVKVSTYSENIIYVGTNNGNIFRINNAIDSPTSESKDVSGYLPNGRISSIDIGTTEDQILLTYSNYGVESVWQTLDGGTTWKSIEYNLPDMPIRWGLYNPNNTNQILLATEMGVWSINDISTETEWEPSNSGLANVRCDQLKYRSSDKMVAVATYGRGLFTSDIFTDPQPLVDFLANRTVSCSIDTIKFTDLSTKDPNAWEWTFAPSTVTYLNGTDQNSQNPFVRFNEAEKYTVGLKATNNDGFGIISKTEYIRINDDCHYIMSDDTVYACGGVFYDSGYKSSYPNGQDYTMTFYSNDSNPEAILEVDFLSFGLEYEENCGYDYLNIYDGANVSAPLIGKYCGNNSPGEIRATNKVLTFQFHSDPASVGTGWRAEILCITPENIEERDFKNNISIYPNPTSNFINIKVKNNIDNLKVELIDLTGRLIYKSNLINENRIDISDFDKGIYFVRITSDKESYQWKIILE